MITKNSNKTTARTVFIFPVLRKKSSIDSALKGGVIRRNKNVEVNKNSGFIIGSKSRYFILYDTVLPYINCYP